MKKELQKLIVKLRQEHQFYDISSKNFMAPEVSEKLVDGLEVVEKVHTAVVQLTVFQFNEGKDAKIILKVDGIAEGATRAEAMDNATIAAINTIGIF